MEILRTSAQKKFPACVDLRIKRPNTLQTSAGKCPQFSMRNITFFVDISGMGAILVCDTLLIVLGFNNTSTLVMGYFLLSPREREKRDKRSEMKERGREERGTQMKLKKQKKYM